MDNIQIEITNACHRDCSNCTRLCGHFKKPYMMPLEDVKTAVDATIDYPKIIGIMGGEPLLHPQFQQICEYALEKVGRERLGLWTALPDGYEKYAETIVKTFKHVFINDHSRPDIYHAPVLIGVRELATIEWQMWDLIDRCWVQNSWSASINPYGAYFCEIAAALALLFEEPEDAWPVDSDWWKKTPKDFTAQMERFCPRCGMAAPLSRRLSNDGRDDISPLNAEALKNKSRKLEAGKCIVGLGQILEKPQPMASYKDTNWRNHVCARYGFHLTINERGYWEPHMGTAKLDLFSQYDKEYKQWQEAT